MHSDKRNKTVAALRAAAKALTDTTVSAYKRGVFVPVKDLPRVVQKALKSVKFNKRDIEIESAEKFRRGKGAAFEGNRSYNIFVNLRTNKYESEYGSWGGANMFEQRGADVDDKVRLLPNDILHIQGEGGGRGNFARIYVNKATLAPLLPSADDVTDDERKALAVIDGIKSSYRKDEFRYKRLGEYGPSNPILKSLLAKKMIKVNRAGAISVTTQGKNAL